MEPARLTVWAAIEWLLIVAVYGLLLRECVCGVPLSGGLAAPPAWQQQDEP